MAKLVVDKKGKIVNFYRDSHYDIKKSDFNVYSDQNIYYVTNNTGMYMGLDTRAVGAGNIEYIIKDENRCVFGFSDQLGNKIQSSFVFYARFDSGSAGNGNTRSNNTKKNNTRDNNTKKNNTRSNNTKKNNTRDNNNKKNNTKSNNLNQKKEFSLEQLFPHRN